MLADNQLEFRARAVHKVTGETLRFTAWQETSGEAFDAAEKLLTKHILKGGSGLGPDWHIDIYDRPKKTAPPESQDQCVERHALGVVERLAARGVKIGQLEHALIYEGIERALFECQATEAKTALSEYASALGKRARGRSKHFSDEERQKRASRLAEARAKRWPHQANFPQDEQPYVSISALGDILQMTRPGVRSLIDSGKISTFKFRGREFVLVATLEKFLKEEQAAGLPIHNSAWDILKFSAKTKQSPD